MSFSAGVYTLPTPALVPGQTVSSSENNTVRNDMAASFNLTWLRNGTAAATANIPMGGYKLTGLGVATTSGDALSYGQAATVSTLTATGAAALNGGITVDTSAFTVADTTGTITTAGNLTFTGTGNRITGDFSNATLANRVAFQTSTTNGSTQITAMPNGTSTQSQFTAVSGTDLNNANGVQIRATSSEAAVMAYNAGSASALPMTFYTGGSERMRIDTSGNVGIGTSSPSYLLNVVGNTTGQFWAGIKNTNAGSGAIGGWIFGNDSYNDVGGVYVGSTGGSGFGGANSMNIGSWRSAPLAFFTNNTERMRIDSSGNVGIGTSSPQRKLDVTVSDTTTSQLYLRNNNASYAAGIVVYNAGGEASMFRHNGASDTSYGGANSLNIGTITNNAFAFITNNTERMRIQSGGPINFHGSATPANSGSMTDAYGTMTWTFGGQAGSGTFLVQNSSSVGVYIATGNTSWTGTSDGRLKDIIGPVENGIDKVIAMNPVRFTWKDDVDEKKNVHLGFIAQEMREIEPDIVEEELNGNLGITYTEVIPILVKAIQELKAELDATKAEVAALKAK